MTEYSSAFPKYYRQNKISTLSTFLNFEKLAYNLRKLKTTLRYYYEMSTFSRCLCAIALIQYDTTTSKMTPLLDKRNPLINAFL